MVKDMYYGNKPEEADKITIFFSDSRCCYWGHIYKNKEIIGDYNTPNSLEIESNFPQFTINWD